MAIRFVIAVIVALTAANLAVAGHEPSENIETVDPESKAAILGRNYYREPESEIVHLITSARLEFISQICHVSGQGQAEFAMDLMRDSLEKLSADGRWLIATFDNLSSNDFVYFREMDHIVQESLSYVDDSTGPEGMRQVFASTVSHFYALERYVGKREEYDNTADWFTEVAASEVTDSDWLITVLNAYKCIGTLGG